jgi:hypothetical protein
VGLKIINFNTIAKKQENPVDGSNEHAEILSKIKLELDIGNS